jgi:hypothetical protein
MSEDAAATPPDYYTAKTKECFATFDLESRYWAKVLALKEDQAFATITIKLARVELQTLIPRLPDIGGDANPFMREFLRSARYLAFFMAMDACGKSPADAGRVVHEAVLLYASSPTRLIPPPLLPPSEEFHRAEKDKADRSRARTYPGDYVYEYIAGDGVDFDFGYNFTECASHKLYRKHDALDFLPYFCFTDFALSRLAGHGLTRTLSLSEGHEKCNHRMMQGRKVEPEWPPAFLPLGPGV